MKHGFLILAILASAVSLSAQPDEYRSFMGISVGISLPSGSFASTSPDDEGAGYARPGFTGSFSAGSLVKDWFGFAGMISYHNQPFHEKALTDNYLATRPGYDYQLHSDPYSMLNFVVGPYLSVPQGVLDLGVRGYIGMAVCTLPSSSYSSYSGVAGDPYYMVESIMNRATSLVYGGGLNLLIRTGGSVAFQFDAYYLYSDPGFDAVEVRIYEYGQLVGLAGVNIEQSFSVFGLNAGLAFTF